MKSNYPIRSILWVLLSLVPGAVDYATAAEVRHPRDGEIRDPDTLAWWHTTEALSGDDMEGRDTGSPAYQRAANYVAKRFEAAGLQPGAENGSYFQTVLLHEIAASEHGTDFTLVRPDGSRTKLKFLEDITYVPAANAPAQLEGALTFRGYCGQNEMEDVAGKIVVCFGTQRANLPSASSRIANARAGRALGVVSVDDPYFTIEPPRWPAAYARTVSLRSDSTAAGDGVGPFCVMRISATAFAAFVKGTGHDVTGLLEDGGAQQRLPSFEIPSRLQLHIRQGERDISSPNVLAVLPGVNPNTRNEYVVVSAHLDGYGFGTPVNGDKLYNGTLDDAAYVALLIQMADDFRSHRLPAPERSILFAAFTGEEKGLLGSKWYVGHPTVPVSQLAADVNLDQLRPLFPLDILTVEALEDTTLGSVAQGVATTLNIQLRKDAEPERNLLRRADQIPFLLEGVPAISFIFGYDPGTVSEQRYREWYKVRYHRPQDDLTQPVDFAAAARFNDFFYKLVVAIAASRPRPEILPGSQFAPKKAAGAG
jgi:Zn-dependent M28 family amino/carboxypeptidase